MIRDYDRNDRRMLRFPAVRPGEGISTETLLESLIELARVICSFQSRFFATQKRSAREAIRQVSVVLILLEEIRDGRLPSLPYSAVLCLTELHVAFQKARFLLDDCDREGARILILMKSYLVATQFQNLVRAIATALEVLPLDSIGISSEISELIEMLSKQARREKMKIDPEDESAMNRVMIVLNQFENKHEPDPFMVRRILGHLQIYTWIECQREIKFLDEEIKVGYLEGDEGDVPLLSSLVGFLNYCRAVLFADWDSGFVDHTEGRCSNLEVISCLNPEDFRCPISLELMTDPVTVSTGQTYDRASIEKWLKSGNLVCPKTGERLTSTELVPNTSLRKLIQQYCAEYGVSLAKSIKNNHDISRTILPGSPANEGAIKLLSEFLTLSLGYGSDTQKNKATYEIRLLAKSNLFNRSCLIESGCIQPLLELIDSTDPTMQENAISALLKLSKQPNGQKAIIENGGLDSVLRVLKKGMKPEAKQIAAAMIFYLSSTHSYRKMIGENHESIPALLELIKEGTPCGKKNSIVALFALLSLYRNRQRAIAGGAVPILLDLLHSSERVELKKDTLAVLSTLADNLDASIQILQVSSALPLILRLIQSIESGAGKEYCVSILHSLCLNCGFDVLSVLASDRNLMSVLYSLLTNGTSHAGKKARSLIKILQRFSETGASSQAVKQVRQEPSVNVR